MNPTSTFVVSVAAVTLIATGAEGFLAYTLSTLEDYVRGAAIVARVRIVEKGPQLFGDGSGRACGTVYTVRILEGFRDTNRKSVKLFAESDHGFAGLDRDYLVIAHKVADAERAYWDLASLRGELPVALESAPCRHRSNYRIGTELQSLVPFAGPSEMSGKGEWLRATSPSIVIDERFKFRKPSGPAIPRDGAVVYVSWESVREVLVSLDAPGTPAGPSAPSVPLTETHPSYWTVE